MRKIIVRCVLLVFLLNMACSDPGEDVRIAPDKVRMVLRTAGADTTQEEAGIDAVQAEGTVNAIQLMWYQNPESSQLQYYRIYRSEDELGLRNYTLLASKALRQPGIADTIYIDTQDLRQNVRYYYYVTAVDKNGAESENSDTLSYRLLEKASNLSLNGNSTVITKPDLRFEWIINFGIWPDKYIMRIENLIAEDFHPVRFVKIIDATYVSPERYTLSGDYLKQLLPDGKYRWRVDCVGGEDVQHQYFSGSESDWYIFTVEWSNE